MDYQTGIKIDQESEQVVSMQGSAPVTPRRSGLQIFLASLVAISTFVYLGYLTYVKAYVELAKSIAQTAQHESAAIKYVSEDQKTEFMANLAGSDKLQEFQFKTTTIGGSQESELNVRGLFDETNGYVQANYSKPEEITEMLKALYPLIEKTKTYAMISPVWMGQSWLHFEIPKTNDQAEVEWNWEDQNMQRLAWDWFKAVKPGKITKNFEYEGQEYKKIAFGFRKDQLIKAINNIKDMDVEVKVSQINSMVKLIESSDDWDKDLFTVLIDQNGDVRVVIMQLPKIEEKYLDDTIAESTQESDANPVANSMISGVKNLLWKQEGEMVQLGVVTLNNFNEVREPEKPEAVVELIDVLTSAQSELGPVIAQLLGASASVNTQPKTANPSKPSATRPPAVANCIQYKIREGEFASDKCYVRSDYDDLLYYLQRYSAVASAYNGEAAQANMTCGGQSEMFKQSCEESKVAMQQYESELQNYANTIKGIIARGR